MNIKIISAVFHVLRMENVLKCKTNMQFCLKTIKSQFTHLKDLISRKFQWCPVFFLKIFRILVWMETFINFRKKCRWCGPLSKRSELCAHSFLISSYTVSELVRTLWFDKISFTNQHFLPKCFRDVNSSNNASKSRKISVLFAWYYPCISNALDKFDKGRCEWRSFEG